ncbi:MAG: hypothetical protein ACTSUE_19595 [Promethearchaeota archaeon]
MVQCPVCEKEFDGITKKHLESKEHKRLLKEKGFNSKSDPALKLVDSAAGGAEPDAPEEAAGGAEPDAPEEAAGVPRPKSPKERFKKKEDDKASKLFQQFQKDMKSASELPETPVVVEDQAFKPPEEDPHKPKKKKQKIAKITIAPSGKAKPVTVTSVSSMKEIQLDLSLLEPHDSNKGMAGDITEHYLGGDFTQIRLGGLIFKFKDRMNRILNFQLHLKGITEDELNDIEKITVQFKTNLADEKSVTFTRESFSAFDDQRVFAVGEEESAPDEYFSDHESMRISDEYRTRPEITFTIRFLKVHLKSEEKERLVEFKNHAESIFKYRLVIVKLGGAVGRFMENIMSKLVFLTFLMSVITFLSQNTGEIGQIISMAGVGMIALVVLMVLVSQAITSKRVRDTFREKAGAAMPGRKKKIVIDDGKTKKGKTKTIIIDD